MSLIEIQLIHVHTVFILAHSCTEISVQCAHKTMCKSRKVRCFIVRNLSEVHGLELCKKADKTNG